MQTEPVKAKRQVKQTPVLSIAIHLEGQSVASEEGKWTRQVMMRAISAYIKTKDLQLAEDKKKWVDFDSTKLFSLEKGSLYTFMNINGLISRVVA